MITYEDTGQLLGLAAARDQRTVGEADILAWHTDLNAAGITYADAERAISVFYLEMAARRPQDRYRATPVDLIDIARRARRDRLESFRYEPGDADETPRQYLARLRGQLAGTADGRRPATGPAIEGARRPVGELLTAVGRQVPGDEAEPAIRRPGPLGRDCPKCGAAIGRPCRTGSGRRRDPHGARRPDTAPEDSAEAERRRAASAAALARLEGDTP